MWWALGRSKPRHTRGSARILYLGIREGTESACLYGDSVSLKRHSSLLTWPRHVLRISEEVGLRTPAVGAVPG